jgi:hypothetical protein
VRQSGTVLQHRRGAMRVVGLEMPLVAALHLFSDSGTLIA